MTTWLREQLVCPIDGHPLSWGREEVVCEVDGAHLFPVYDGIPVMSRTDVSLTQSLASKAVSQARGESDVGSGTDTNGIDWFVQENVGATCGFLYIPLAHRLTEYPIPDIRLPPANGARLLDIGCNWGRWLVAAARKGYRPVGVDINLEAVLAARRVCRTLGVEAEVVVADARFLPFAPGAFDAVYSYSVIQHFSKTDAKKAVGSAARVLADDGHLLVQMPNQWGLRSLQHQVRQWRAGPAEFDVRYWSPAELTRVFGEIVGAPAHIEVDGFLGLGIQTADVRLMPGRFKAVIKASATLSAASRRVPGLHRVADSLFVRVQRQPIVAARRGESRS